MLLLVFGLDDGYGSEIVIVEAHICQPCGSSTNYTLPSHSSENYIMITLINDHYFS